MATSPIAIERKSLFQQSLPAGWRLNPNTNKTTCEDNSVSVFVDDKSFEGSPSYIQVGSLAELEEVKQLIKSRPIFTTAKCGKIYNPDGGRRGSQEGEDTSQTHTEDYIVLVDTNHPHIAEQFNNAFDRAERYLRENKKFRITVGLSESMKIWFMNNVPLPYESKSSTYAAKCDIYLVNGAEAPNCGDRCFTCETTIMKLFWCICFPFFLLFGLPFIIYKKFIKGIHEDKIAKAVPVTFHEGPIQMGFNLRNLFYPPGTTITTITNYQQPYTQQPYTNQQQPVPYQQQPVGYQQQPAGYQQQPVPYQQQPVPYQQQPPHYQQSGF